MHVSSKPIESECLRISSRYFLNHMHVSSKPIKSECLRISSFFFQIICTFLLSQSKVSVSEFHQVIFQIKCTFLLGLSKVSVSEFHQFFHLLSSFSSTNQNRVSHNFYIQVWVSFRLKWPIQYNVNSKKPKNKKKLQRELLQSETTVLKTIVRRLCLVLFCVDVAE